MHFSRAFTPLLAPSTGTILQPALGTSVGSRSLTSAGAEAWRHPSSLLTPAYLWFPWKMAASDLLFLSRLVLSPSLITLHPGPLSLVSYFLVLVPQSPFLQPRRYPFLNSSLLLNSIKQLLFKTFLAPVFKSIFILTRTVKRLWEGTQQQDDSWTPHES